MNKNQIENKSRVVKLHQGTPLLQQEALEYI